MRALLRRSTATLLLAAALTGTGTGVATARPVPDNDGPASSRGTDHAPGDTSGSADVESCFLGICW
jgi:hypothetical protein